MGTIKEKTFYELTDCAIIGVEAGNVNKVPENETVIAFTVKQDGPGFNKKIKTIVKGNLAHTLYNVFLASGNTVSKTLETVVPVRKDVTVSLIAVKKEDRHLEIVLENPSEIEFKYNYKIID